MKIKKLLTIISSGIASVSGFVPLVSCSCNNEGTKPTINFDQNILSVQTSELKENQEYVITTDLVDGYKLDASNCSVKYEDEPLLPDKDYTVTCDSLVISSSVLVWGTIKNIKSLVVDLKTIIVVPNVTFDNRIVSVDKPIMKANTDYVLNVHVLEGSHVILEQLSVSIGEQTLVLNQQYKFEDNKIIIFGQYMTKEVVSGQKEIKVNILSEGNGYNISVDPKSKDIRILYESLPEDHVDYTFTLLPVETNPNWMKWKSIKVVINNVDIIEQCTQKWDFINYQYQDTITIPAQYVVNDIVVSADIGEYENFICNEVQGTNQDGTEFHISATDKTYSFEDSTDEKTFIWNKSVYWDEHIQDLLGSDFKRCACQIINGQWHIVSLNLWVYISFELDYRDDEPHPLLRDNHYYSQIDPITGDVYYLFTRDGVGFLKSAKRIFVTIAGDSYHLIPDDSYICFGTIKQRYF